MMDQIMIINSTTLQIEESISTEFSSPEDEELNCMSYDNEMECNMARGNIP